MEAKLLIVVFSFLSLYVALSAAYDSDSSPIKVYEIRSPLVLNCNVTGTDVFWQKNGTDVSKVPELKGRYEILPEEKKFIISRTDTKDDGLYSCGSGSEKVDITVVSRVVVRVPSNVGVVEGEKLTIACTAVGTHPRLYWTVGNLTLNSTSDRYILKADDHGMENAIIMIEKVTLEDRGEFKCNGRNAANDFAQFPEAYDVSMVRVKGKLAALWPFLGICAEVLILCLIILIYEKRRNKTELEESDTDPQDQ